MARLKLYMTPKEVAAYLGMSECWVYRRIRLGGGPPFRRRGSRILYLATDVAHWDQQSLGQQKPKARPKQPNSFDTHVA